MTNAGDIELTFSILQVHNNLNLSSIKTPCLKFGFSGTSKYFSFPSYFLSNKPFNLSVTVVGACSMLSKMATFPFFIASVKNPFFQLNISPPFSIVSLSDGFCFPIKSDGLISSVQMQK